MINFDLLFSFLESLQTSAIETCSKSLHILKCHYNQVRWSTDFKIFLFKITLHRCLPLIDVQDWLIFTFFIANNTFWGCSQKNFFLFPFKFWELNNTGTMNSCFLVVLSTFNSFKHRVYLTFSGVNVQPVTLLLCCINSTTQFTS